MKSSHNQLTSTRHNKSDFTASGFAWLITENRLFLTLLQTMGVSGVKEKGTTISHSLPHTAAHTKQYQWCWGSVAAPNNFYSVFKWKSAPSFISMNICCVCVHVFVNLCAVIVFSEGQSHTDTASEEHTHTHPDCAVKSFCVKTHFIAGFLNLHLTTGKNY